MSSRPKRASHARADIRPLDQVGSIKLKLGILIVASVSAAAFITWVGMRRGIGPVYTFPLSVFGSLIVTQVLARGMTSPLREMTAAARAMAKGDYSRRVTTSSRDEVGELARAFNIMSEDLGSVDDIRREMIANVSHELRTPVAALRAQLENMVDGVTTPDAENLGLALSQTERLGRLVGDLLNLSRIEAGAAALNIETIRLDSFFADAVRSASLVASSTGHEISWSIQVLPPKLDLQGDPERLHQVIANLLNNAIRHSPSNGSITIKAYARGKWVLIEVRDEGPGIPTGDRDRIFERFEHGNNPRQTGSNSTGGTGLGLSIARWVVTMHGGSIGVIDSSPGATFRIRLPRTFTTPKPPDTQNRAVSA